MTLETDIDNAEERTYELPYGAHKDKAQRENGLRIDRFEETKKKSCPHAIRQRACRLADALQAGRK